MEIDKRKSGIYCFVMPFASLTTGKHASRLIEVLIPNSNLFIVACDKRINLNRFDPLVYSQIRLIPCHYLNEIKPKAWSAILWVIKLVCIILHASSELVINRRQVDVVICYQGSYYTPILIIAKLLGKNTLIYEPANEAVITKKVYQNRSGWRILSRILNTLSRINRTLADLIVIQSSKVIEQGQLKPYLKKLRIVNNNLNVDVYKNIINLNDRKPVVGFMGRLSAEKGVIPLLQAARLMRNCGVNFKIVGDGPLRQVVIDMLRSPEMSHVKYVGWMEQDEIVKFLNEIRLFILPSSGEGIPNSVLEAMACGTPVLVTPVGGITDLIVHAKTGFLLNDTNPETIASSIIEVFQNPDLESIARCGQEYVRENYSLEVSSTQWAKILCEVTYKKAVK